MIDISDVISMIEMPNVIVNINTDKIEMYLLICIMVLGFIFMVLMIKR